MNNLKQLREKILSYVYSRTGEDIENRPITLEDVLISFKEKYLVYRIDKKAYFDSTMENLSNGAYLKGWQLNKPLKDQSEETIKALNELIK